jgi:hypothetical protein
MMQIRHTLMAVKTASDKPNRGEYLASNEKQQRNVPRCPVTRVSTQHQQMLHRQIRHARVCTRRWSIALQVKEVVSGVSRPVALVAAASDVHAGGTEIISELTSCP